MLSAAENELVCRTGPGTPAGEMMRRYWQPFLLSIDLPEWGGPPVRVRILSEDLIAFRTRAGKVGLLEESCPHRGASLYYGINDEETPAGPALMCIYHGWAFDTEGRCIDMPSDAPGSTFKGRVRANSYPVFESAGMLWTYMGPPEKVPPYPDFAFNHLPPEHVVATRVPVYCNYLQSIEGNIDSTHIGTLHVYYQDRAPIDDGTDVPGYPSPRMARYLHAKHRHAQVDVQDTQYGFRLIAIRDLDNGNRDIRINCHVLPVCTYIASPGKGGSTFFIVPTDDGNCMRFVVAYNPDRSYSADERQAIIARNMVMEDDGKLRRFRRENDYGLDRQAQKTKMVAGIWPVPEQDYALTETMGAIFDRTREHLYPADNAIIRLRQMLIKSARDLQEGIEPPALDPSIPFSKIRSEEIIIGPNDDPWLVAADAGETAKRGEKLQV